MANLELVFTESITQLVGSLVHRHQEDGTPLLHSQCLKDLDYSNRKDLLQPY